MNRPLVLITIAFVAGILLIRILFGPPSKLEKAYERSKGNFLVNKIISIHQQTLPKDYANLLGSIIFGLKASPISPELKDDYKKAGVIHILVASGQQVAILIGVCLAVRRFFKIPILLTVILISILNLIFVFMTGAGPSIIRAAIMGELTLLGLLFERERDFYTSLAMAALLILIWDPLTLFDIGFQLTFTATWSLVYLAPLIEDSLKKFIPQIIASPLAVAIAPVSVTTPISVYYFNQLSLIAVFSNLLVVPLAEILTVLGFLSTVLGLIFLPLAEIINGTNFLLLKCLNSIVEFFSHLPGAYAYVVQPSLPLMIGYYAGIVWLANELKAGIKMTKNRLIIIGLTLIALIIWHSALSSQGIAQNLGPKELRVSVLDVGQGDSILVEAPSGKKLLIDGGEGRKGKGALPILSRKGINKLDMVILTHPHDDHVGGLPAVLKNVKVDEVLDSGQPHPSKAYIQFLSLVNQKEISYKLARAGQIIDLGADIKGYVLNPSEPFFEGTRSDLNNNSVVIRLVYKKVAILLTGDLEKEGEGRVLNSGMDLKSDVLKVGHHGSSTATSERFLKIVDPKVAIISVGAGNPFHHPHPSALKRLEVHGIQVYRTDKNGTIIVKTDGEKLLVEVSK